MEYKTQAPKRTVRIVLITSKHARSGKDLMADILYNIWKEKRKIAGINVDAEFSKIGKVGMMRMRFAAELIAAFESIFDYQWDIDKLKPDIRKLLTDFAEFTKKNHKYLWINKTLKKLDDRIQNSLRGFLNQESSILNILFTDCRYAYEYREIRGFLIDYSKKYPNILFDLKLVEVVSNNSETKITDRDHPEDAIWQKPDIVIYNPKGSLEAYQKEIEQNLSFIFD